MTRDSRVTMHKGAAALIGVGLVVVGAATSYVFMRSSAEMPGTTAARVATGDAPPTSSAPPSATAAPENAPLHDVVVPLSAEAAGRAGIVVAPVASGTSAGGIRLPGVVEPNAYREVVVTPLVSGRVTRVAVELGARVRRGQSLAEIYSPGLPAAQTKYISAKAMLEAHDRELERTQKLVEIGAASRQELERVHAEHAAQTAAVQSARSPLQLLGLSSSTIEALGPGSKAEATVHVPAPIDGVITERAANVGLNVDQATPLFTVVDLSTVWIVADVYEKDFARVRIGSDATVTTSAYPALSLNGRISYIDPQVNPETRTAKVRVEVPNPRGELKLGMYAEMIVAGASEASVPVVPRSAIQHIGDRTVVYLANPKEPGTFTEREVRLGEVSGEQVEITAGLQPGDVVVTAGSFFIRAERERLGLRPPPPRPVTASSTRTPAGDRGAAGIQSAKIVVNEQGLEPAKVTVRTGTPARLTFIRTTDKTCGTEVVLPSLDIKRALPLNEPVRIEFMPEKNGEVGFACGMNMLKGVVVVQ